MSSLKDYLSYYHSRGPLHEGRDSLPDQPPNTYPVRIVAYYLPQFHPIPENNIHWGEGFTEWTNVTKAMPRYVGHYQPRLPADQGYYDLRHIETIRTQAKLAAAGGIYGFCIHNYWFSGKKVLETPLEIILSNTDINLRFFLCWANESWTRRWDGQDNEIILKQNHSPSDDLAYIDSILPAIDDDRYIHIDGRPVIMVYRPGIFPDFRATTERWRAYFKRLNRPNPYIIIPQAFGVVDPRPFGADAAAGFPPHKSGWEIKQVRHRLRLLDRNFAGQCTNYDRMVENALENQPSDFTLFPGVCPDWDNEARKPNAGHSFFGSTPEKYGRWLRRALQYAVKAERVEERLVLVNAWNEWAEGAYLEPDRHYGFAYLAETARALADFLTDGPAVKKFGGGKVSPRFVARESILNHLVNRAANIITLMVSRGRRGSSRVEKA